MSRSVVSMRLDEATCRRIEAEQRQIMQYDPSMPCGVWMPEADRIITWVEYCQTDWWLDRRERSLKLADYRCQMCGETATQVHHRDDAAYSRAFREMDSDLTSLCRPCHVWHHERRPMRAPNLIFRRAA